MTNSDLMYIIRKEENHKTILSVLWSNDYETIKQHLEDTYEGFHHGFYKNIFHAYVAYASGVDNFEFKETVANYLFQKLTEEEKNENITALIFSKAHIPKDKFLKIVNYFFELDLPFDIEDQKGLTGTDYIKIGYTKYIKKINKKIIKELLK